MGAGNPPTIGPPNDGTSAHGDDGRERLRLVTDPVPSRKPLPPESAPFDPELGALDRSVMGSGEPHHVAPGLTHTSRLRGDTSLGLVWKVLLAVLAAVAAVVVVALIVTSFSGGKPPASSTTAVRHSTVAGHHTVARRKPSSNREAAKKPRHAQEQPRPARQPTSTVRITRQPPQKVVVSTTSQIPSKTLTAPATSVQRPSKGSTPKSSTTSCTEAPEGGCLP